MKLPFEYVAREVDKLYDKSFEQSEVNAINEHCEFIRDFIHACGWSEDELLAAMYPSKGQQLSTEELNKLN